MADFEGKTFSPKESVRGGPITELTYNHPDRDKPVTIKSWPHTASDPQEQEFLESYSYVKVESSAAKSSTKKKEES